MNVAHPDPALLQPTDAMLKALGAEAARDMTVQMQSIAREIAATKVDKSEYDAHAALIGEKFERFQGQILSAFEKHELRTDKKLAEVDKRIASALVTGLAWVTILILGSGVLNYFMK